MKTHSINKIITIISLGLFSTFSYAQTDTKLIVQADVYSEALSIDSFTDNWRGSPLKKGDTAFAQGKIELRQEQDAFQYGIVWQYDYLLHFTPDTARLYYQVQNKLPLTPNAQYDLLIKANHIESVGFRFGYTFELNQDWQLNTGLNILKGRKLLQGDLTGFGQTNSAQNTQDLLNTVDNLQANIDYNYSKPALKEGTLGWNPDAPTGYGVSIDMMLTGLITPELKFIFAMNNLYGRMRWDDVPNTRYDANYELNRLPHFNVTGQLSQGKKLTQKLPYRIDSSLTYQPNQSPWSASASLYANELMQLWQVSAYRDFAEYKVGLHAEPQTETFGLSVGKKNFGIQYMTDDLNTNHAKRMSLGLYGLYQW